MRFLYFIRNIVFFPSTCAASFISFCVFFFLQIAERQKSTVEKENTDGSALNYDPVAVVNEKATFLLKFAGLSKIHLKMEVRIFVSLSTAPFDVCCI
jgi:hypothetical protein